MTQSIFLSPSIICEQFFDLFDQNYDLQQLKEDKNKNLKLSLLNNYWYPPKTKHMDCPHCYCGLKVKTVKEVIRETCELCGGTGIRTVPCWTCGGSGVVAELTCPTCKGAKKYVFTKCIKRKTDKPCSWCNGRGSNIVSLKLITRRVWECDKCNGLGFLPDNNSIDLLLRALNLYSVLS